MNTPPVSPAGSSLPDMLFQWLKPGAASHLRCSQISDHEFHVEIIQAAPPDVPGPLAMLGYARKFHAGAAASTDEIMHELRAGDRD